MHVHVCKFGTFTHDVISALGTNYCSAHLSAYRSVFSVCSHELMHGEILAIITVRELPRNESRRMCVSLL